MNNKRKIYIVGGGPDYVNWMDGDITNKMDEATLVCFTGGEDVSPSFYSRIPHPTTGTSYKRDIFEREEFLKAQKLGKKMIGICRGSQFLCAMSGGILVQHQENPSFYHHIDTYDGKRILITSTHHQAQYPFLLPENEYKVLAWTNNLSDFHYGQSYQEELNPPKECEIVYYPKTKAFGIQGHPEIMFDNYGFREESTRTIDYLTEKLDMFMDDKL